MKQCKTYPGYTNFYTYTPGERTILLERTRHAQGGEVIHRQVMEFTTPEEAMTFFNTECGA